VKKITISSGLAFVCAAALTAVLVSMSFAQDSSKSEVIELKDKIKNMENRIEQYKKCVSQERSGEIILYKDPSTSDCMAISTVSFTDYLKEKGLTTSRITERLADWNQKSSEIKKSLEENIALVGSELKELKDNLARIEKRPSSGVKGASVKGEKMPAGVKFPYTSGRAEADGRKAELYFDIKGVDVEGRMIARSVCKPGIRLLKTQITFSGKLNGPWEQKGSVITADWKGGDYGCNGVLMKEYPKEGSLTIKMRLDESLSGSEYDVFLKRTASSAYGFVFKPLGKKYNPKKTKPDKKPSWIPGKGSSDGKTTIFISDQAAIDFGPLGPPAPSFSMPSFSNTIFQGTVALSHGETRIFIIRNIEKLDGWKGKGGTGKIIRHISYKVKEFFPTRELSGTITGNGVTVRGEEDGVGQLQILYELNSIIDSGKRLKGLVTASWLVLVGKKALEEYKGKKTQKDLTTPPADIPKVIISGKAKRIISDKEKRRGNTESGVAGAFIHLIPDWNQKRCKTSSDGSFECTFSGQRSGRYELMIQKPSGRTDLPPGEAVDLDLWPIKKYMLELDPKKAAAGTLDVGVIWMDSIGSLCTEETTCREKSELRGKTIESKKNEEKAARHEGEGDKQSQTGDLEEAKKSYNKSLQLTNDNKRKTRLLEKIKKLGQEIEKNKKGGQTGRGEASNLSGTWREESNRGTLVGFDSKKSKLSTADPDSEETIHATWTFERLDDNRYKAHFEGEIKADGIALKQGNKVTIDFTVDNIKVQYDLVLSPDGTKAVGKWISSDGESENVVLVRDKPFE